MILQEIQKANGRQGGMEQKIHRMDQRMDVIEHRIDAVEHKMSGA